MDAKKRRVAKRPQIRAIMRPIFSFSLSAMWRKHNIWENIAAKLNNNGYKRTWAPQCKTKIHNLEQKYKKANNLD